MLLLCPCLLQYTKKPKQSLIKPKCKVHGFYGTLHGLIDPYAVVSNQFRLQLRTSCCSIVSYDLILDWREDWLLLLCPHEWCGLLKKVGTAALCMSYIPYNAPPGSMPTSPFYDLSYITWPFQLPAGGIHVMNNGFVLTLPTTQFAYSHFTYKCVSFRLHMVWVSEQDWLWFSLTDNTGRLSSTFKGLEGRSRDKI